MQPGADAFVFFAEAEGVADTRWEVESFQTAAAIEIATAVGTWE